MLVRLAKIKYIETGKMKNAADALELMLQEELFPNAEQSDGWNFRNRHCYNLKVDELFQKNMAVIKMTYKDVISKKK